MTRLTPAQFDGLTIEERDAFLERRDKEERRRAISRGGASIEEIFLRYASELVRLDRALVYDIRALAARVAERCRQDGITNPRGEKPYTPKTAYNHITQNRLKLLDALAGEIPASMDLLLQSENNQDHGTAENGS